jgi:hypothetical protein
VFVAGVVSVRVFRSIGVTVAGFPPKRGAHARRKTAARTVTLVPPSTVRNPTVQPVDALGAAPNITETLWPVETENGLAGLELTPDGSPVSETCTVAEKPFCGAMETVTGELAPPCGIVIEVTENAIAKSGTGQGGWAPPPLPPPPHAAMKTMTKFRKG